LRNGEEDQAVSAKSMFRFSLICALSRCVVSSNPPPPMILIPGLTNSILEYQLVNAAPFKWCPTDSQGTWAILYPPPNMTLIERVCWQENFAVYFNETSQSFQQKRKGVNVRLIDFGGLDGMPAFNAFLPFWQQMGFTIGKNLFGAPYDWRYPTTGRPDSFFADLQHLVEHAYAVNGNRKVFLLAPSFGPQFGLGFLHRMTADWKKQYVDWFIAESPVFSGVYISLMEYISGVPYASKFVAGLVREEFQGLAIPAWMFPRAGTNSSVSWTAQETILSTPSHNYSAFDVAKIYSILNFSDTAALKFVSEESDLAAFAHPGVNTLVTYGFGLQTPGPFAYPGEFVVNQMPDSPSIVNISGDDLVPLRSSLRGTVWQDDMQKAGLTLIYRGYENQAHANCLLPPGFVPGIPDDGCYTMVNALIVNGTVPPQTSMSLEAQEIIGKDSARSWWF
jgi:hypothetical protein